MADDKLDPGTTALVLIDLQAGIVPFAKGPYTGEEVLTRAARLVSRCRDTGSAIPDERHGPPPLRRCKVPVQKG